MSIEGLPNASHETPENRREPGVLDSDEVKRLREAIERVRTEIREEGPSESREAQLEAFQEALQKLGERKKAA